MAWLLDTNVLCEPIQTQPTPAVITWLERNESHFYTAAFCIAELWYGVELMPRGSRRSRIETWLQSIEEKFGDRILRFDTRTAHIWGTRQAELSRTGRRMPVQDSYIAAIAERHNLIIATRNRADFVRAGLRTFDPFRAT
jgi:toxin FitB